MNFKALTTEMKQLQQSGSEEAIRQFFIRHWMIYALARIYMGGRWLLRACLWTLVLLLAVVGLKVLWLAIVYMWGLV